MMPLNQLRLRLPAHEFARVMQAANPVAEPDRDAFLKHVAAELGSTKWPDPACYIGLSAKCSGAIDVADQRRTAALDAR